MSKAKICDRCGRVYGNNDYCAHFDAYKNGRVRGVCVMFENPDPNVKNAYLDLCDNCSEQLVTFLKNKEIEITDSKKTRW